MKKYACLWVLQLMLVSVALSGCASSRTKNDMPAVEIAKQEMRRRGWKRIELDRCAFRDGVWVVDLYKPRFRGGANFASVRVSTDGAVVDVFENLK